MKQPSEKQMNFANKISNSLNKPVPTEKTAQAYFLYISENLEAYQEKEARLRAAWKKMRRKTASYNKTYYLDDEEDASWAAAMDFSWM